MYLLGTSRRPTSLQLDLSHSSDVNSALFVRREVAFILFGGPEHVVVALDATLLLCSARRPLDALESQAPKFQFLVDARGLWMICVRQQELPATT